MPENANKNPIADVSVYVMSSIQLLNLCCTYGVRKIIFVSSGGTVYGIQAKTPITETAPTHPVSVYGINKLAVEKYLYLYHFLYGLDYTILRVANPYGPYQNPALKQGIISVLMRNALQKQTLEIWGSEAIKRDFIYIDDVIEALLATSHYSGTEHLFNIGSGVGRSLGQVLHDVQRVLGCGEIQKIHKPSRITDVPSNILDISLIRREVGWEPRTPWSEGLAVTAEWHKNHLEPLTSMSP